MVLEDSSKGLCDVLCNVSCGVLHNVLCDEFEVLASKEDTEGVSAPKASDDFAPP